MFFLKFEFMLRRGIMRPPNAGGTMADCVFAGHVSEPQLLKLMFSSSAGLDIIQTESAVTEPPWRSKSRGLWH